MAGDFSFPIRQENFEKYYYPLWNDLRSQTNIERIPRLIMMSPYLLLSEVGIDVSAVLKIYLITTYSVLTISMFLFIESIRRQKFPAADKRSWIFSIIGGFLFAYNPVSLQFSGGISILFSLGILPLMLTLIISRPTDKCLPFYLAGLLLLSLGHPFTLVMNALIALATFGLRSLKLIGAVAVAQRASVSLVIFSFLFAWYLLPYFVYPISYEELGRAENISEAAVDTASNNAPHRILLLERDRFLYVDTIPAEESLAIFHFVSLSAIFVLAVFVTLLFIPRTSMKIAILLVSGYFVTAVLAMGTSGILGSLYYGLVDQPNGWIFRSPLKFQLYESFFLCSLFGMALHTLPQKIKRTPVVFALGVVLVVGVIFYGVYDANTRSLKPIKLPDEYYEISDILAKDNGGHKVVYYPIYSGSTTWSEGHSIQTFDSRSSPVPAYEIGSNINLVKEMLSVSYSKVTSEQYATVPFRTQVFFDYLSALGVKYVVFHDDTNNAFDKGNLNYLKSFSGAELVYNKGGWHLFQLEGTRDPIVNTYSNFALSSVVSEIPRIAKNWMPVVSYSNGSVMETLQKVNPMVSVESDGRISVGETAPELGTFEEFSISYNYEKSWKYMNGRSEVSVSVASDLNEEEFLSISNPQQEGIWFTSESTKVEPDQILLFSLNMNGENAQRNHVKLLGFSESDESWINMDSVVKGRLSDHEWKQYWWLIQIPHGISELRYAFFSATPLDNEKGPSILSIKQLMLQEIKISDTARVVEEKKLSPTEWVIKVNSTSPYLLVLPEVFDHGWQAEVNDKKIDAWLVNGMITGFFVQETGIQEVLITYSPQTAFELGGIIALMTSIISIGACLLLSGKITLDFPTQ
jgi:hypothetical protein